LEFRKIVKTFTTAVENNDGEKLASLFTVDGIYDDYIYGEFKGRRNIAMMLPTHFHRDAKNFSWEMYDLLNDKSKGYARYRFSFTSTLTSSENLKVAVHGMAYFQFEGDLIEYYSEVVNGGIPMAQLNLPAGKIKRVFEKWSDRALDADPKLKKLYTKGE
ncbi:nuclear transport factor 2 family protein, partial [Paracoccaceae bacterium]|nr:nuclear transport factor 2 family protein [Paracoccaceae bacterium]